MQRGEMLLLLLLLQSGLPCVRPEREPSPSRYSPHGHMQSDGDSHPLASSRPPPRPGRDTQWTPGATTPPGPGCPRPDPRFSTRRMICDTRQHLFFLLPPPVTVGAGCRIDWRRREVRRAGRRSQPGDKYESRSRAAFPCSRAAPLASRLFAAVFCFRSVSSHTPLELGVAWTAVLGLPTHSASWILTQRVLTLHCRGP